MISKLLRFEVVRYIIVGGGAVAIDFIFYYLIIWFGWFEPEWAKRISFVLGAVWSFFANKFYTFKKPEKSINEPVLFAGVYISSFFLNTLVHDLILKHSNWSLLAFTVATFISIVWNYLGQKWLVFRKKKESVKSIKSNE